MIGSLCCKACGNRHKATSDNFPLVLYGNKEIFKGEGKEKRLVKIKQVVIGYICVKCIGKYHRQDFVKRHSIKAEKGQKLQEAINKKFKELKMSPPVRITKYQPPKKQTGWDKVKRWTKNRFFKKRGRE